MAGMIRRTLFVLALLLIAALTYALWPRQGDLRHFDADAVARLETGMWRDYYARDHRALAAKLYSLYRVEYHFSPSDSARLAYAAGKAAQLFQPTRSRAEAQVALPALERYYKLLRVHSGESFNPEQLARLELDWWQLRRENATPAQYGEVVAQVAEGLFGVRNEQITQSALLRAEMMQYRDERRNGGMQPADWAHIEQNLVDSYRQLKAGVTRAP